MGAIEDYTRVIELDPDHALAHLNRGKVRDGQGDHEGAIEDYTRALRLTPADNPRQRSWIESLRIDAQSHR